MPDPYRNLCKMLHVIARSGATAVQIRERIVQNLVETDDFLVLVDAFDDLFSDTGLKGD